jgi:hypothetical protein
MTDSNQIAGSPEAAGIIHGGGKGERGEMADAGDRHQSAAGRETFGHLLDVGINRRDGREHRGTRCNEALHGGRQPGYSLDGPQRLFDEGGAEGPWQAATEYHGESTDLVLQHDPLAGQLLARDDQCANGMRRQRLHVHGLEEVAAGQMGEATRIIASVLWVASDFSA